MYNKIINLFTKTNTHINNSEHVPNGIFYFFWTMISNDLSIKIKHITINGNNFYI